MSSNPYENEPGFENAKTSKDKKNMEDYAEKVGCGDSCIFSGAR